MAYWDSDCSYIWWFAKCRILLRARWKLTRKQLKIFAAESEIPLTTRWPLASSAVRPWASVFVESHNAKVRQESSEVSSLQHTSDSGGLGPINFSMWEHGKSSSSSQSSFSLPIAFCWLPTPRYIPFCTCCAFLLPTMTLSGAVA